ncbi:MAG TPA: hypothetical protein VGD98_18900 [Ktedonobacteraceae bacterium]
MAEKVWEESVVEMAQQRLAQELLVAVCNACGDVERASSGVAGLPSAMFPAIGHSQLKAVKSSKTRVSQIKTARGRGKKPIVAPRNISRRLHYAWNLL